MPLKFQCHSLIELACLIIITISVSLLAQTDLLNSEFERIQMKNYVNLNCPNFVIHLINS